LPGAIVTENPKSLKSKNPPEYFPKGITSASHHDSSFDFDEKRRKFIFKAAI
jgi:hypothetical protein